MLKKNYLCGVCPGGCAVDIELKDGKIESLEPSSDSPFSSICLRGRYAKEIVYSEDRIKTPLIRVGEKGEGKFREASWDEALDFAAESFLSINEKHGPESLCSHHGRGAFEQSTLDYLAVNRKYENANMGFFEPLGSPNYTSVGSVCYNAYGVLAPVTLFGIIGSKLIPDVENAKTIFVWGSNPATDSPPFMFQRLLKEKKRGLKIVAVDHFKSDICKRADNYYLVRSGTDGALLLGIINQIIEKELYDKKFVEDHCYGFDELKEYVKSFDLDRVSKITKLRIEEIEELVKLITEENMSTLLTYTGLEYSNSGTQAIRALYSIWAIMDRIDRKGGILINDRKKIKNIEHYHRPPADSKKEALGEKEYPLFHHLLGIAHFMSFPKAVLEKEPYEIKGLLNIGSSIITSYPNSKLFAKALKQLDFLCVIDRFMTEDTKYADLVLPSTTYFEDESYFEYGGFLRMRERVIEPVGEARTDIFILHELAKRLGYGELYPKDEEELLKKAYGKDIYEKLLQNKKGFKIEHPDREYEKFNFPTETGKIELKSRLLEEFGYPGLPEYIEPIESPVSDSKLAERYPLVLNTGTRIQTTFRSQHLNIEGLLKYQPVAEVMINSEDAKSRGISDGDKVVVSTKRDSVEFRANVTDGIPKGEVELNMGGGAAFQSEGWRNSNTNFLTDNENVDYISGFPVYKALLCEIEKA